MREAKDWPRARTAVRFLEGRIEALPLLPDASVDVAVSHCVIDLSVDNYAAFAEAFGALRSGGRLAVADVVAEGDPDVTPPAGR
jgi:arsenite methyltransferase